VPARPAQRPPVGAVESAILQFAKEMESGALRPTLAVGVVAITVGILLSGVKGAVGGLLGVLVVLGSGYLGLFVMRRAARSDPTIVFAAAMGTYLLKVGLLLLFALAFGHTGLFDRKVFALTAVAGIVVWAAGQALGFRRAKVPTIIPATSADPPPTGE
jgi:ATP synthase protein I